ncbi:hypothetical protein R3P38DRAFT_3243363 [Favolaschia claudopus]|uniref:Uncharacterized protein n=1 Tax=Favolaschia claudopus TaxID=2862362 RepID=A0AAV9Z377_9AGAR
MAVFVPAFEGVTYAGLNHYADAETMPLRVKASVYFKLNAETMAFLLQAEPMQV